MSLGQDIKKISTAIKIFRQAFGEYKWQIVGLTALGFLSGLFEGIGINALIPLFSFITGKTPGGSDAISQIIEKLFLFLHLSFSVRYLLIFIALLFVLKALVLLVFSYVSTSIILSYEQRTRGKLLGDFLNAKWSYLLEQKLGYLEKIVMLNVQTSSRLLGYISSAIMIFASLTVYIVVAINISWRLTLITLLIGGLVLLIIRPIIYKIRIFSGNGEKLNKKIAHHINESILGMKTIKVMAAGENIIDISRDYFSQIRKIQMKSSLLSIATGALMQPISVIFILAVFAFYYRNPSFNLAALVAIIYLIKQMFNYFSQLQKNLVSVNATVPYLKIVLEQEQLAKTSQEINQGIKKFKFNQALELKQVDFSYADNKTVLSKIDFKINKGEIVGIIGPSGSGKTTLVDLILRLFRLNSGQILLDGINIEEIEISDWRNNIGYVSQDIFLMNDSIINNIRFHDDSLTMEDIISAAKMANIYDFIQSCPEKFETIVGERGIMLSGGQRQRIIIARVLARNPKFLIFDEATSALDNESEVKIQKIIENLKGKLTVFVIAHRLSTVINSDRLLVLENGKIIEQGVPKELLANKNTYFYKMYNIRK